ncbi:MAG: DNA repair protein RadA [Candidatus Nomurabacteria bacterium]|nr:DNA repair protein RadA [Candidatus Saccharibacteria bacterium]USN95426.1 MAG: DNA repair protein RadA [Candidatus Nomurabacteria bacterium]
MAKTTKRYICSNCGAVSQAWSGKCHACGEWNRLEEDIIVSVAGTNKNVVQSLKPQPISEVIADKEERYPLKFGELDRILGGGIVKGAVMLFAGEPGIGKSTLLMQVCDAFAKQNHSVLYVSGEESAHQVGIRAKRLGVNSDKVKIVSGNVTEEIVELIKVGGYKLVVVDSIQTLQCLGVGSSPGSVSQITNSTHQLMNCAKQTSTSLIIVGHVTKEGTIAGPKILEHIVDAVFQLEGDRYGGFKVLRSVKNRYGSTNETVLFDMMDYGLQPIDNPSKALLAQRRITDGSIVLATMEGSRPILVEVQALVNKTSFGYPKRATSGLDLSRLNVLVAMLERRTKLNLSDKDIYVNIVGGIKIQEPASDLAICMAIGSASRGLTLKKNCVVFGEVGLSGEVRHVPFIDKRIDEAKKLGFEGTIGPVTKKNDFHITVGDVKDTLNIFLKSS